MKKIKEVLFVHSGLKNYSIPFFNEINSQAKKENVRVDFLFTNTNFSKVNKDDIKFNYYQCEKRKIPFLSEKYFSFSFLETAFISSYDCISLLPPDKPNDFVNFVRLLHISKKMDKKVFLWWNPPFWRTSLLRMFYRALKRVFLKKFYFGHISHFFTYCNLGKENFEKIYGVPKNRVSVARNSLDSKKIILNSKVFLKNGKTKKIHEDLNLSKSKILVFVGQLIKGKNLEELFLAVKDLNNIKLIVIGDGSDKAYLEGFVGVQNISRDVIFVGKKTKDAEAYINLADLVVLPGLGGLSVNHAMACEKPVLSSIADGTPLDLLDDSVGGILRTGNRKELVEKISKILSKDTKKMGIVARKRVQEKANIDKKANIFINKFKE